MGSEGGDHIAASVGVSFPTGKWTTDDSDGVVPYLGEEVVLKWRSDSWVPSAAHRDGWDMSYNPEVISDDSGDSHANMKGSNESDDLSLSLSESESTEEVEEDVDDDLSDEDYEEGDEPLYSSDEQERGGHKKTRADKIKKDDVVVISKDEFSGVCEDARIDRRKASTQVGLRSITREPSSNNDSVDKASKIGGWTDRSTVHNASEEVHDDVNESGSKRRKVFENLCSPVSENDEFDPWRNSDSGCIQQEKFSMKKVRLGKKKTLGRNRYDLIKILLESMNSLKEGQSSIQENDLIRESLLLKFRFEGEVQSPPAKSEWETGIDSLFGDLELGLRESEIYMTSSVAEDSYQDSTKFDESPAAFCRRGDHLPILDEQIGIICEYCRVLLLDIKYVLPDFHTPPPGRRGRDRVNFDISSDSICSKFQYQDSASGCPDSINSFQGTVWDLIPGVEKEMYLHQRQAFEFMWRNLAGDIRLEKLQQQQQPLSHEGRGCIISHAMGTGKTRLTIMFLLTFLKLYPSCHPVIIAPPVMLLAWEAEFIKWDVNIPIHNLSKEELSSDENALAANIVGQTSGRAMSRADIRVLKLLAWMKGGSILGMSYQLFQTLAGENGEGQKQHIRKVLLDIPGLLVLDEGHTPRNNQSRIWNALMEIRTHRRIILSGTLYQNNLKELYNTLCLVNPKFVNQIGGEDDSSGCKGKRAQKRWMELTSSIGKSKDDRVLQLKRMLDLFIHVHQGEILEERLPGLSECLVFLHPTELQKAMLETASKEKSFIQTYLVSLISVHPSLITKRTKFFPMHKHELKDIKSDIDAGVKTKFIMKLIWLADARRERVLIFSQFLRPLVFLKKQIISRLSWTEGREVLYMDGKFNEKRRQESILSFNDDKSKAKVLLASEKACSEGISLVGASRVVLLDTVWNPSVEKQAISRAYRLGQNKVVYVYRLFTSGTEVRQYAQQVDKKRISELIVCPVNGGTHKHGRSREVPKDQVLEAMRHSERLHHIFEDVICQPKESDLIKVFGLMDQK